MAKRNAYSVWSITRNSELGIMISAWRAAAITFCYLSPERTHVHISEFLSTSIVWWISSTIFYLKHTIPSSYRSDSKLAMISSALLFYSWSAIYIYFLKSEISLLLTTFFAYIMKCIPFMDNLFSILFSLSFSDFVITHLLRSVFSSPLTNMNCFPSVETTFAVVGEHGEFEVTYPPKESYCSFKIIENLPLFWL